MRHWSTRSLNNLKGIHPDLRRVMDRALQDSPLDFAVIEGLRSKERQAYLVEQGKSWTMKSRHITGHAVDLMPFSPDGTGSFAWTHYDILGPAVKKAAKEEGVKITWGGDWAKKRDGPHFELTRGAYPPAQFTPTAAPPKERTVMQSKTVQVTGGQLAAAGGLIITAFTETDGIAQYMLIGIGGVLAIGALWIMKDRLRRWAGGDR